MSIFDKLKKQFVSEQDRINQSHLRNLFLIAISGTKITDEDYKFIENLGNDLKLSKSLIYEVFNSSNDIKSYRPSYDSDLHKNICSYVMFATRDGQIIKEKRITLSMILLALLNNLRKDRAEALLEQIIEIVQEKETVDFLTYDRIGRCIGQEYLKLFFKM